MIADILGVPREDRDIFKRVAGDVVNFMNRANPNEELTLEFARYADDSLATFRTYLRSLIDDRRRSPRDDMVSILSTASSRRRRSTTRSSSQPRPLPHRRPRDDDRADCERRVSPSLDARGAHCRGGRRERLTEFLREALRYESPVQRIRRVRREDVELGGVAIPAGEPVEVLLGSANRDPAHYERPDDFLTWRPPSPSLAFGKGVHFCIGESLALLEAEVAFRCSATVTPNRARRAGGPMGARDQPALTFDVAGGHERRLTRCTSAG